MLFLDGVYASDADPAGLPKFRRVPASTTSQLQAVLARISQRIGRYLERSGWVQRDADNGYTRRAR